MVRYAPLVLAAIFVCSPAIADEVHLLDGSKLIGAVTRIAGGKVTIKTDFAGAITVDTAKIKGISTTAPANFQLDTGDTVVATLEYDPATGAQSVRGDVVGARPVELKQVASAWPRGEEDPAIVAARPKWKIRLDAGINGQSGNSEIINANGALNIRREAPADRLSLYLTARYTRDNGRRTTNEIIAGALQEFDLNERLFWYLKGELEHDEFENLDLRATATTGFGYFLIREKETELKIRGGLGYQHEAFDDGSVDDQIIAEAGLDFRKDFAWWLQYIHSTTVQPSLENLDDLRIVMSNALEIPLVSDKSWKLKLGVKHQYDAQPEPGVERLDTFYFANIGVDF